MRDWEVGREDRDRWLRFHSLHERRPGCCFSWARAVILGTGRRTAAAGRGTARRWRHGRGRGAGESRPATAGAAAERDGTRAPSPRGARPGRRARPGEAPAAARLPPSLAPSFPAPLPPARRSCRAPFPAGRGSLRPAGGVPQRLAALPPRPEERGGAGRAPPVGGPGRLRAGRVAGGGPPLAALARAPAAAPRGHGSFLTFRELPLGAAVQSSPGCLHIAVTSSSYPSCFWDQFLREACVCLRVCMCSF